MSLHKELSYGSKLHNRIRDAVLTRRDMSKNKLADRRRVWAQVENRFMLATNTKTDNDRKREQAKREGKPQFTTVEIPYSYAMLLTTHTYLSSVFLARDPVHQYVSRHGEPEQAAMSLEAVIGYQTRVGGAMVPYYIWLHDTLKYGIGITSTYWTAEDTQVSEIVEEQKTFLGLPIIGSKPQKVKKTKTVPGYHGNRIFNVRPQDWRPDPRVSFANFQKGEFCGRYVEVGWNTLVRGQESGQYFNLQALKLVGQKSAGDRDTGGSQMRLPEAMEDIPLRSQVDEKDKGFFFLEEMEIEIIPTDWELGQSRMPEKWIFTVGNDQVVIGCRPCGYYHGQFNFDVMEYEIEGYNLSKRGMVELLAPLNDTMEWLFNTHFFNVRKSLNDQFIVDPSKVVMKDMTDPDAGKLIRLKPEAYGTDARTAVHQLVTQDVTRTHMNDAEIVGQIMQRATGAMDNIMGMLNGGGRKTATEVRSASSFGVNRIKTLAEYNSAMGMAPHSQKLVQNTQQYLDIERAYRIAGDLTPPLQKYLQVGPDAIQGFFDFVPVDGTMPIDRFAIANLWKEMLANMGRMPQIAMSYDLPGIFSWVARLSGMRNIEQFRVNMVPDQQFQGNLQAGNTLPIGAKGGIDGGTGDGGGYPGTSGVGTIAGMGPTA